jgi:hypothetical protein
VVNEVALNEIMPKGFMATRTGKRNMDWRNDQAATLYYVEAIDAGNPENKVDFRDEVWQWKAPFDQNASLVLKTKQRFGVIWEMQLPQLLLMNGTILEIQKPIYSIRQMPLKIPK